MRLNGIAYAGFSCLRLSVALSVCGSLSVPEASNDASEEHSHKALHSRHTECFRQERTPTFFRYHLQRSYAIMHYGGVMLKVSRQETSNMQFVGYCGKELAFCDTLTVHVNGFQRAHSSQRPCQEIHCVADLPMHSGHEICGDSISTPVAA